MPTKLRRIAVTEDPELAQALSRASKELPGLSDAALVKELALRGAGTLPVNGSDERIARIIAKTGAKPARGDIREYLRNNPPGEPDPEDPNKLSRILDEMREDKI
ncbi:MAG: hypothetical protein JJE13_13030 [Thermoleophilia bacterium]|nr:hypothetical protein [Thermoleophilia bacterium]